MTAERSQLFFCCVEQRLQCGIDVSHVSSNINARPSLARSVGRSVLIVITAACGASETTQIDWQQQQQQQQQQQRQQQQHIA